MLTTSRWGPRLVVNPLEAVNGAVGELARRLGDLGWVDALMVAGSLATGDYIPGVSDVDLVVVTTGAVEGKRRRLVAELHETLDAGVAAGLDLGCVYVARAVIGDLAQRHPTWTHGRMVDRTLSGITRVELALHGYSVSGPEPLDLFPRVARDDVRAAARAELNGYWAWAARRPWLWFSPMISDLGLTGMARGRHALSTGTLLTKSDAVELARVPSWLRDQLRARRHGENIASPRIRTALVAWADACRTVGAEVLLGPLRSRWTRNAR